MEWKRGVARGMRERLEVSGGKNAEEASTPLNTAREGEGREGREEGSQAEDGDRENHGDYGGGRDTTAAFHPLAVPLSRGGQHPLNSFNAARWQL